METDGRTDARTKSGKPHVGRPLLGPAKTKDWASQILKDLSVFEITLSMDQIENTPSEA